MSKSDFAQIQTLLRDSNERVLLTAAHLLGQVFASAVKRPPDDVHAREGEITAAVRDFFPMRFVDTYQNWIDQDKSLTAALSAGADIKAAQAYRTAFDALWQNWLRIVHFFPFILMVCINRLNRSVIKQHAAEDLGKAISYYEIFYRPAAAEEKREADQRKFLEALLKLFRKLSREGVLGDEFFLGPALRNHRFSDLLPERFDAEILLLQQIRNLNTHQHLGARRPLYLAGIYSLLRWCFLDIVSLLAPICETFRLVYITEVLVETDPITALGLSLSGVPGPTAVRYLLPARHQTDASKLHYGQLYIIARGKEDTTKPLEPRDYLDLTPFLIFGAHRPSRDVDSNTRADEQRHLFLLNEYEETKRYLQFLEFAGAFDRTIPENANREKTLSSGTAVGNEEQYDATRLLDEIRSFKDTVLRLGARPPAGAYASDRGLDPNFVLKKFWDISKSHLTTIVPVEQFTEEGADISDATPSLTRTAYVPELFVAPPETEDLEKFFASSKRGLVLVGPSGAGKSSLMAHAFLARLRAGTIGLFLSGRLISDATIATFLKKECFSRLADKELQFSAFDSFLRRSERTFALFVDAVNEFSQQGGSIALLENLLNFVKDDHLLKNCRVVVSVRSETWSQFCDHIGSDRPLDTPYFYSQAGGAINLGSFDTEQLSRRLFDRYRAYFKLLPPNYDRLSLSVRDLIRRPFMMALVAETYSNVAHSSKPEPQRSIPSNLNYFELFHSLTNRKASDAARLFPASDERARVLPGLLKSCLYQFALLVHEKLAKADLSAPGSTATDAVPYDQAFKFPPLQPFHAPLSANSSLSVFAIALQLGLIDRTFIPELDELGQETQGRAFKFFHDQYTQLWLAAVYNKETLGPVSTKALARAEAADVLVGRIADLIARSVNAPVLAGALDHWYYMNMRSSSSQPVDFMFPLLNALVNDPSGGVRYYVSSLLSGLMLRDIVPASDLCSAVFRNGNRRLRLTLADAFNEFWLDLGPGALAALLEAADKEKDDFVFGRLADVFALHFADSPDETLNYISEAVMQVNGFFDLTALAMNASRFEKHLTFSLFFTFTAVRSQSDSPAYLTKLHDFIYANYRLLIESLVEDRLPFHKNIVRSQVHARIQDTARDIWERLGATQNGNNYCFVEHNGLCQRDVIYEFFPYAVAMHNGDFETFSVEPGKPLRDLAIRMLTFDVTSIVGYKATVVLPFALRADWEVAKSFILDVLAVDNRSARFFGILLLVNLSYTEPALADNCLELLHEKILPGILQKNQEADWVILHCMGVVDIDVPRLWPGCERILGALFDHFTVRGDEAAISKFGDELLKAGFFHDIDMGIRLVDLMLSRGCLEDELWHRCLMKVLAGLMARNPAAVRRVLDDRSLPESVLREVRGYLTEEVLLARDLHTNQVSWNRFFGNTMLNNVILRCLTIKCIVGGFAQSNSTAEYAKEFRRFLVSAVRAYFGHDGDESNYMKIDVEEALNECENRRRVGGGVVHDSARSIPASPDGP